MRTANVDGNALSLTGDMNSTIPIEIIGGAPSTLSKLTFNGEDVGFQVDNDGIIKTGEINYPKPKTYIPKLNELKWKYIDALPELQSSYLDSAWTRANLNKTYNSLRRLSTPTSLYASDYGYHSGTLLYRGHFTATGAEKSLYLFTQGGSAFGASAWINGTFLGSWRGYDAATNGNSTFTLPNLVQGKQYVITVVIDHMGLDENWVIGVEMMKNPRGILDYSLDGHAKSDVQWRITGNLGGEDYEDLTRGPLNEGGLWVERQGLHLPGALSAKGEGIVWKDSRGPVIDGISKPGVGFFAAEFELGLPSGYDIPLSFAFTNGTSTPGNYSAPPGSASVPAYRVQIYVNGWQFGKYVSNVGPQTTFPVPEGILNYHGKNYLGIVLWGLDAGATKIQGLELGVDAVIWSGREEVGVVEGQDYARRTGA